MMSGTSGDGIDAALVEFSSPSEFELLWYDSMRFSADIRARIKKLMIRSDMGEVLLGGSYMALLYAQACETFFERNQPHPDFIAAHGQTILHLPQKTAWDGFELSGSLQLMNGSLLALKTGVPVICNFREADMAVGGQGAPLVPFADLCFFGNDLDTDRIILNIGGIANVTVLKKTSYGTEVVAAFDTGPGNMLMDAFCELISNGCRNFDENGTLASSGRINEDVVQTVLADSYFDLVPPKSTGREKFGVFRLEQIRKMFSASASEADVMSTLLEITVRSIVSSIKNRYSQVSFPAMLIVAGGGALNAELMKRLRTQLNGFCEVFSSSDFSIPVMAREAMAFAALGNAFIRQIPSNVPVATGAKKKVLLGQYHPSLAGHSMKSICMMR
jgi:anhydro-N-acetylmuramic acid kinase